MFDADDERILQDGAAEALHLPGDGAALLQRIGRAGRAGGIDDNFDVLAAHTQFDIAVGILAVNDGAVHVHTVRTAAELDGVIRGLTPIPGAYVTQNGKMLKIAEAEDTSGKGEIGEVIAVDDKGEGSFTVACGEGALKILRIKPEGKGVMTSGDYIRGRKISKGDILN